MMDEMNETNCQTQNAFKHVVLRRMRLAANKPKQRN